MDLSNNSQITDYWLLRISILTTVSLLPELYCVSTQLQMAMVLMGTPPASLVVSDCTFRHRETHSGRYILIFGGKFLWGTACFKYPLTVWVCKAHIHYLVVRKVWERHILTLDLQSKPNVSLGNEYLFELAVLIDKNKRIFQIPLFQKTKQRNKQTQSLTRLKKYGWRVYW